MPGMTLQAKRASSCAGDRRRIGLGPTRVWAGVQRGCPVRSVSATAPGQSPVPARARRGRPGRVGSERSRRGRGRSPAGSSRVRWQGGEGGPDEPLRTPAGFQRGELAGRQAELVDEVHHMALGEHDWLDQREPVEHNVTAGLPPAGVSVVFTWVGVDPARLLQGGGECGGV